MTRSEVIIRLDKVLKLLKLNESRHPEQEALYIALGIVINYQIMELDKSNEEHPPTGS